MRRAATILFVAVLAGLGGCDKSSTSSPDAQPSVDPRCLGSRLCKSNADCANGYVCKRWGHDPLVVHRADELVCQRDYKQPDGCPAPPAKIPDYENEQLVDQRVEIESKWAKQARKECDDELRNLQVKGVPWTPPPPEPPSPYGGSARRAREKPPDVCRTSTARARANARREVDAKMGRRIWPQLSVSQSRAGEKLRKLEALWPKVDVKRHCWGPAAQTCGFVVSDGLLPSKLVLYRGRAYALDRGEQPPSWGDK